MKCGTNHYSGQEAIERQINIVLHLVLCIVFILLLEMLYSNALLDHRCSVNMQSNVAQEPAGTELFCSPGERPGTLS